MASVQSCRRFTCLVEKCVTSQFCVAIYAFIQEVLLSTRRYCLGYVGDKTELPAPVVLEF